MLTIQAEYSKQTLEKIQSAFPDRTLLISDIVTSIPMTVSRISPVFRLYNPNSGEHLFTSDRKERRDLMHLGWNAESIAWMNRPDGGQAISRLYNPNAGDHHYTADQNEVNTLVKLGWKLDGTVLFSEGERDIPIYRCCNPNAKAGSHHFTRLLYEYETLTKHEGWIAEGIAFYATSSARQPE